MKPRSADYNENILSEQARDELGLTDELIRTHGNSFEQVLSKVRSFLFSRYLPLYPDFGWFKMSEYPVPELWQPWLTSRVERHLRICQLSERSQRQSR